METAANLAAKHALLDQHLRASGRTLIAYSGGVDSAFLAWAAHQVSGQTTCWRSSPILPAWLAPSWPTPPLLPANRESRWKSSRPTNWTGPEYARNDSSRCFHCKDELFTVMEEFRARRGFDSIAYGVNLDDQGDFRPGQQAAEQHHVAAPLRDADLTKLRFVNLPEPPACAYGTSPPLPASLPASSMGAKSPARLSAWSSKEKTPFAP